MPKARDLDMSLITKLYFETLLVAGPRHMPPDLTNLSVCEKMTQAMEAIFRV